MKNASGLQLTDYLITSISIKLNQNYFHGDQDQKIIDFLEEHDLDIDFDCYQNQDDKSSLLTTLRVSLGNEDDPLSYSFDMYGKFSVDYKKIDEEELQKLLPLNPVSMLYSIARGITCPLFAKSPMPDYVLPTINFASVLKEKAEREKAKQQKEQAVSQSID